MVRIFGRDPIGRGLFLMKNNNTQKTNRTNNGVIISSKIIFEGDIVDFSAKNSNNNGSLGTNGTGTGETGSLSSTENNLITINANTSVDTSSLVGTQLYEYIRSNLEHYSDSFFEANLIGFNQENATRADKYFMYMLQNINSLTNNANPFEAPQDDGGITLENIQAWLNTCCLGDSLGTPEEIFALIQRATTTSVEENILISNDSEANGYSGTLGEPPVSNPPETSTGSSFLSWFDRVGNEQAVTSSTDDTADNETPIDDTDTSEQTVTFGKYSVDDVDEYYLEKFKYSYLGRYLAKTLNKAESEITASDFIGLLNSIRATYDTDKPKKTHYRTSYISEAEVSHFLSKMEYVGSRENLERTCLNTLNSVLGQ